LDEADVFEKELRAREDQMATIQTKLCSAMEQGFHMQQYAAILEADIASTESDLQSIRSELVRVYESKSWKITAPLRKLIHGLRFFYASINLFFYGLVHNDATKISLFML